MLAAHAGQWTPPRQTFLRADDVATAVPRDDRSVRLALQAAAEALDGHWTDAVLQDSSTGLFVGTSKGPIGSWLAACAGLRAGGTMERQLAAQIAGGVGNVAGALRDLLGMRGMVHTSIAACASGLFALHRAAWALASEECDRALVVASDASLHPLFEASFATMGVLAPLESDGRRYCRPFDPRGRGFFLSEGAAAVLLERPSVSRREVMLDRIWVGADGTHLLAIDPATQSLRYGLAQAAGGGAVAFVHAHATGTAHDQHELAAIRGVLGDAPHVFSSKGSLGHTLGAAGLISLVLSVRAHHNARTPDGAQVPAGGRSVTVAQGFGGHIALAALRGA